MKGADYFHHLHHRYFECNYGNRPVPLDRLFGTFHDGTPEGPRPDAPADEGSPRRPDPLRARLYSKDRRRGLIQGFTSGCCCRCSAASHNLTESAPGYAAPT